jgi:hypothetical protein
VKNKSYVGQLAAYARALRKATNKAIVATYLHLPLLGVVMPVIIDKDES